MRKSNYKVICFILAVFLLLIGAPFFVAQTRIMFHEISDVMQNQTMIREESLGQTTDAIFEEKTDVEAFVHPMSAFCNVKVLNTQRHSSIYSAAFYIVAAAFALANKSFFPTGRYSSYNYIRCFLIELRIIHRSDGKCRKKFLCDSM